MAQSPNPQQMYGHYPPQGYAPQYQTAPEYQYTTYSPQPPQQAQQVPPPLQPTPEPAKDPYGSPPPPQQHQSFYGADHFQQQQQQQQHQQLYGAPGQQPQQVVYMMAQPSAQYPQQAVQQQQSQPLLFEEDGGGKKNKKNKAVGDKKKSRALSWLFTFSLIQIGLLAFVTYVAFRYAAQSLGIRLIVVILFAIITAILACIMPRLVRNGKSAKVIHSLYGFLFSMWMTAIILLALTKPWVGVSSYTRRDLHGLERRKGGKGGGGGSSSGGSSSSSSSSSSDSGPNLTYVAQILVLVSVCVSAVMLLLILGSWISMCIRSSKEKKRYSPVGQQAWPADHHRSVDMSGQPEKPHGTV